MDKKPLFILITVLIVFILIAGVSFVLRFKENINIVIPEQKQSSSDGVATNLPQATSSRETVNATSALRTASTSQLTASKTVSFQFPYSVAWTENWSHIYNNITWETASTEFSLTGVSIGGKIIPSSTINVTKTGAIYALTLFFKVKNTILSSQSLQCVPLYVKRVLNEEGDLGTSTERSWTTNSGCLTENKTYFNQELNFEVSPIEKDFLFTSGGSSNIYFLVHILPSGIITVETPSTSG